MIRINSSVRLINRDFDSQSIADDASSSQSPQREPVIDHSFQSLPYLPLETRYHLIST